MKRSKRKTKKETSGPLLSDDILEFQILPRLPVKSLSRFKSVCKRWCTTITEDPIFRRRQSQKFKPASGLVFWENTKLTFLSTDGRSMNVPDPCLRFLGTYVNVSNSCNGLICGFYVRDDLWPEIYVCNPATKELRSISNPKRLYIVGLAFDASAPNPHYELICPYRVHNGAQREYGFDVFSSVTGVWRESKERIRVPYNFFVTGRSYFAGGVLYFRAANDVVWFHSERDEAGVTELPISNDMTSSTLGEYNNRLCYTQVTHWAIEIWTLNETADWEQRVCILLDVIDISCRRTLNLRTFEYMIERKVHRCKFKPLPIVLDDLFLFQEGAKVYFYRIQTGEVTEFPLSGNDGSEYPVCLPYINSLVSIPE